MSLKYENLIRKMTLAEKAIMMSGKNTWETVDFEKYGIPSMVMSGIECQSSGNLFSDSGRSGKQLG